MIKGLNGVFGLSPKERKAYREQLIQQGKIGRRNSWQDVDKLYRNQQYIQKYGLEDFEARTKQQRDFIWKRDILLNEANTRYNPYEKRNPYKEALSKGGVTFNDVLDIANENSNPTYTINSNKGVGDASAWEKIQSMAQYDIDALEELLSSGYKTSSELNKITEKNTKEEDSAFRGGFMGGFTRNNAKEEVATKEKENNNNILNSIYNKFLVRQDAATENLQEARFNDIIKQDKKAIKQQFLERINRDNPNFARYYDKQGNVIDDVMADFKIEDMARYLAKSDVLESRLGYENMRQRMSQIANEYAEEHQGWWTRQALHTKEFAIKAGSYATARVTALSQNVADARSATGEKNLGYVDNNGNIIDADKVAYESDDMKHYGEPYYIDYNGNKNYLHVGEFSPSDMHYQGFTANGVKLPWILNSKAWNDAERFNVMPWNSKALERANSLGASDSQVAYKNGEQEGWTKYLTQTVQMGSFMLVDGLLGILSGTSTAAMVAQGILSANAIGYQYGTGVYAENLQNNMSKLEEKTYNDVRNSISQEDITNAFNERYDKVPEFRKGVNDFIKVRAAELKAKDPDKRPVLSDGRTKYVNNKSDKYYDNLAREEAINNFSSSYLEEQLEAVKNSPEYIQSIQEANESAALGAEVAHITDAAKYSIVNTIGYRKYLFQNPKQLAQTGLGKQIKKTVSEVQTAKGARLKFDATLKGTKGISREVGRIGKDQFIGGAWTNFTDEMQSEGGRAINEDRFAAYLNGEYDGEGGFDTYNPMVSYLRGFTRALNKKTTWEAGLVGGLGSLLPMLNFGSIGRLALSSKVREEYRQADALTKANMLITHGILNEYQALRTDEAQIREAVQVVNNLLDRTENFEDFIDSMALDLANADVTNEHDKTITSFLKALDAVHLLNTTDLSNSENNVVGQVANNSTIIDQVKSTLDEVTRIKNGELTAEEQQDLLKEWYAKNPSIPNSEENDALALQQITDNANTLAEAFTTYEEVSNRITEEENKDNESWHPIIKKRLIQRAALNGLLERSIAENEQTINGSNTTMETDGAVLPFTFGDKSARNVHIRAMDNSIKTVNKEIEAQAKEIEKATKEYESIYQQVIGLTNPTEENLRQVADAQAKVEDAHLQLEYLKSLKESFTAEKTTLEETINGGERVLTKEEIMHLNPVDRARMLDKQNRRKYSVEQRKVLNDLEKELRLKDPDILNKIQEQGVLQRHLDANASAYSLMLENPRAAEVQWRAKHAQSIFSTLNSLNQKAAETLNIQLAHLESDPNISEEQARATVYEALKKLKPSMLKYFNSLGAKSPRVKRLANYKEEISKALDWANMVTNIADAIQHMGLSANENALLQQSVENIIGDKNTAAEAIKALQDASIATTVSEEDRTKLGNLLKGINQAVATEAATKPETKTQAKDRVEQQKQEEKKEEKARKDVENQEVAKESKATLEDGDEVKNEEEVTLDLGEEDNTDRVEQTPTEEVSQTPTQDTHVDGNAEQFNSPTLEEQVAESNDGTEIIELPPDTTDEGNKLPEASSESVLGNLMYRYDAGILREEGIQVEREGKSPSDSMNGFFNWFKNADIKLQEIIDKELRKIIKVNPKIEFLHVNPKKNATNDAALEGFVLLSVEYTDKVAKKHKESRGGVVEANGKRYLIVGTLGFTPTSNAQMAAFNNIKNKSKANSKQYFNANPAERFFVDPTMHTEVQQIGSGRLVRQAIGDAEIDSHRKISDLLADPNRNPDGLELEELKWMIQYETKVAPINVSERNVIHTPTDAIGNKGNVFILVEAANGEYSPIYIMPTMLNEIADGALKKEIDSLILGLTSASHADRVQAIMPLMHWLYLDDSTNILIGTQDRPTVTIVKNGIHQHTFDISKPDFDPQTLVKAVYELNPRINITKTNLQSKTSLEWLDEAGALTTDVAILGTVNASYTVYAVDANGNPIKTDIVETNTNSLGVSSDLEKAAKKEDRETLGNQRYTRKNGKWYDSNGKEVSEALGKQLECNNYIRVNKLESAIKAKDVEFFILNNDKGSPVVWQRNINTKEVVLIDKNFALAVIKQVEEAQLQKEKEEAAKKANEAQEKLWRENPEALAEGEEVVPLEGLTEEELISQEIGEPVREETPQEETGAELLKLLDDTDKKPPTESGSIDNTHKSLSSLQQRDTPNDINGILNDRRYADSVYDILEEKGFEGDTVEEVIQFLQDKNMPIANINNIDAWIDMLKNCRTS